MKGGARAFLGSDRDLDPDDLTAYVTCGSQRRPTFGEVRAWSFLAT